VIVKMRKAAASAGLTATHQESVFLANSLLKHRHLLTNFPALHLLQVDSKLNEISTMLQRVDIKKKQTEEEVDKDRLYKGKPKDQSELDRLLEIRRSPKTNRTKSELRTIYYTSVDPVVKLNALLGLLETHDPIEDKPTDRLQLCSEGIELADQVGASSVKAYILAEQGSIHSFLYVDLDMRTAFQSMAANAVGFPEISEEYRQKVLDRLQNLEKEFDGTFAQALGLTKQNQDFATMAAVLVIIGIAAGQRALYLQNLSVHDRASAENALCRRSLLVARDIYTSLNDELGASNALFNLANQIRFFGEIEESKSLVNIAVDTAKKYGDERLLQKAKWLLHTLETGKIPDYLAGERRE